jgi:hypothetical protein
LLAQLGWQQKLAVEQAGLLMLFILSKHGETPDYACPYFTGFLLMMPFLEPPDLFSGDSSFGNNHAIGNDRTSTRTVAQ